MSDLLDTSILIHGLPPLRESAISVVSMVELGSGLFSPELTAQQAKNRRARYARLSEQYEPIPLTEQVCTAYLDVDRAVRERGRNPRPRRMDLLIAATAVALDLRLVTTNPADFVGLERYLEVVTP